MATRAPLTQTEKEYIGNRKRTGATLQAIAQELDCSRETVRKWWRMHLKHITPRRRGRPGTGVLSTYPTMIRDAAVAIKRVHPHWGPANVQLELKHQLQLCDDALPSDSRLAALFKAQCPESVQPHYPHNYPAKPPPQVTQPHQRWQIDGKEKVPLGDQENATLLDIRDPVGALMIASQAIVTTTATGYRKPTRREVQMTLRQAFMEWGRPAEVQTDHEDVYVGSAESDFPSPFTLWLMGLGIIHITSRDQRPTDQSEVERNHRTLGDMGWKDTRGQTRDELQALLDHRRYRYNHELPVQAAQCQGRPPLQVYPWASHSGRPYHFDLEWTVFDMARVNSYLAIRVWTRQVNSSGGVSIGGEHYYLGRTYRRQKVSVRFIAASRSFCFQLADGTPVAEKPALALSKADLIGYMPLEVAVPMQFQLPLPLIGV